MNVGVIGPGNISEVIVRKLRDAGYAVKMAESRPKANWRFRNMAHTQSLDQLPQSFHSAPFVELRQSFPSQVQVISQFVDQLMRFILHFRPADGSEIDIEMALREALANAVIHGNGENFCKRVHVECRCYTDGEVSISVRDEGRGFDANAVPDPTTAESRLFEHGRGIYLVKTLMDAVSFEESGTVVHMRKKPKVEPDTQTRAA
jgi:serine/threonine-protein kinase RsbW